MDSAGGGLQKSCLFICEVLYLVKFLLLIYNVFGKSTIHRDAPRIEVLTQEGLSTSTIEAILTGNANVGNASVSDLEALDIFTKFHDRADGFMARD